ncbi:MAG: TRL-like family protein [Dissulfuribacterales bacterium]
MKKFKLLCLVGLIAVLPVLTGCATSYPVGMFYTKLNLPISCDSEVKSMKTGTSECKSVLGLVATGDISFEAAMKDGGITKVNHADWEVENILGVIGEYKLTVYGE